jgi:hypothetical protein
LDMDESHMPVARPVSGWSVSTLFLRSIGVGVLASTWATIRTLPDPTATNDRGRARRDTWWQNTSWNDDIEAAFCSKLARARNKSFYLRNQARSPAASHPKVALLK